MEDSLRLIVFYLAIIWYSFNSQAFGDIVKCPTKTMNKCRCSKYKVKFVVDCSNTGLKSIPKGIPSETTHLYLDNNDIKILYNNSFVQGKSGLFNLLHLRLRNNALRRLEIKSLQMLSNLEKLDLYNNTLEFNNSLPKCVFWPLRNSLKVLDIRMNFEEEVSSIIYPTSVSELLKLKELQIDCLRDQQLPAEYNAMKKLTTLIFSSKMRDVRSIGNNTFDSISNLNISEISLSGLQIGIIGAGTFIKFESLKILDLSDNPRLGSNLRNILTSLKNTSLEQLKITNTGIGDAAWPIIEGICPKDTLKELYLDENNIRYIEPKFTMCWKNLEILSLADNLIILTVESFYDIFKLQKLIGFDLSGQEQLSRRRSDFPITRNNNEFGNHSGKISVKNFNVDNGAHMCENTWHAE